MDKQVAGKIDKFFRQFKHQSYKKGEIIIRADDEPTGVFYLYDGIVKEYAISRKGEELVVNIFKPNSFFPMSWAINNSFNKFFYEAMSSVEIWRAPRDRVIEFIKNEPDVLFDLMQRVFQGTDGMLMRMVYLMSGSAYNRLIIEIIICAKRFSKKDKITGTTTCIISEKDLASQAGVTRETISREIKILKQKGLITYNNGKLIIADLAKLEEELLDDFNTLSS